MERLPLEQFDPQGIKAITQATRPIPGQSLTNSPDEPYPWESAPEYTNFKEALDYIVSELIDEEAYISIISGIGQGVPISDVATQILYSGFKNGKWNPDLFLMLIEPVMYVLIALCEKAGVDYTLYSGEEEDDENEQLELSKNKFNKVKQLTKTKIPEKQKINSVSLPEEIKEKIESVKIDNSLLAKPTEEETSILQKKE